MGTILGLLKVFGTEIGTALGAVLIRHFEKNAIVKHYRKKINDLKNDNQTE